MIDKAEYVGGDTWTPVGRCYLCGANDEIRLVASERTGNLYAICSRCIKIHDKVKEGRRRDWFTSFLSAILKFSGGS